MNLAPFTRRLEECRRRWHHRTLNYVVEVARIVRGARKAAKDERRWGLWIRDETRMTRSTVYRYLRVEDFLKANVSLRKHLVSLSIAKIYALSRMPAEQAGLLVRSGKAETLNDVEFLRLASRRHPRAEGKITRPNLSRSLDAAVFRLEHSMKRWRHSEVGMPVQVRVRLQSRLQAMIQMLNQIGGMSAAM